MFGVKCTILINSSRQGKKFAVWLLSEKSVHKIQITSQRTSSNESFLTGTSATYIEDMYRAWLKDPSLVHAVSYFPCLKQRI